MTVTPNGPGLLVWSWFASISNIAYAGPGGAIRERMLTRGATLRLDGCIRQVRVARRDLDLGVTEGGPDYRKALAEGRGSGRNAEPYFN